METPSEIFNLGSAYLRVVRNYMAPHRITALYLFTQTDFTDEGVTLTGQTIYLSGAGPEKLLEILKELEDGEKEEA